MNVKYICLGFIFLLSLPLLIPNVRAAQDPVYLDPYKIVGPDAYLPFRVIVNYPYVSNPVESSMQPTSGLSDPSLETHFSYTVFTADPNIPDFYEVTIAAKYDLPENRTFSIVVYSGDEITSNQAISVYTDYFYVHFSIQSSIKPHYPTAEERIQDAQQGQAPYVEEVRSYHDEMTNLMTALVAVLVIVVGLVLFLFVKWLRIRGR